MFKGLFRYILKQIASEQPDDGIGGYCTVCEGSGFEPCLRCDGFGVTVHSITNMYISCGDCHGNGHLDTICGFCLGSKHINKG